MDLSAQRNFGLTAHLEDFHPELGSQLIAVKIRRKKADYLIAVKWKKDFLDNEIVDQFPFATTQQWKKKAVHKMFTSVSRKLTDG